MPSAPDDQVAMTIGVMRENVARDSADPMFKIRAGQVLGQGSEQDKVERAWSHAKNGIRFRQDKETASGVQGLDTGGNDVVEVIVRPLDMAGLVDRGVAEGDCDDFSSYVAALLEAGGIETAFCTVAANGADPGQYSHVYLVAYPRGVDGKSVRVPVDASHGGYCGWEVENVYGKRREWPVRGNWIGELAMSMVGWWLARWVWERVRVN